MSLPTALCPPQDLTCLQFHELKKLEKIIRPTETPLLFRRIQYMKASCLVVLVERAMKTGRAWEELDTLISENFSTPEMADFLGRVFEEFGLRDPLEKYALTLL